MVPVLEAVLMLGSTEKVTNPVPVPLLPELMVMKLSLLEALHAQLIGAATSTLLEPPLALMERLDGERNSEQDAFGLTIRLTEPPWLTTYISPASSSPNDDMNKPVSSRTLCVPPSS